MPISHGEMQSRQKTYLPASQICYDSFRLLPLWLIGNWLLTNNAFLSSLASFLPIFLVRRPQKRGDFVAFFFVKSGVACSVHTTIVRRRKSKASSPTVWEDVDLFPMGKKKKEARRWRKLPQSTSLRNNVFIRARLARSHCSRARNCLALTTATVLYTSHAAPAENNQRFELNSGVAKESFDFKILFYLSRSGLPKNI